MKKIQLLFVCTLLFASFSLLAQKNDLATDEAITTPESFQEITSDSTGLLGDNFSLEAALEIFKKSESPEDFEKQLNDEKNHVNNLDLNEDGDVDYIRVIDEASEDAHALVLQAVLGKDEAQDVAVIAIEKTGEKEATLQIFGDEYLYGEDMIVEPFEVVAEQSVDEKGPNGEIALTRVVVNVWFWNPIRFIYRPVYRPWRSPFYWGYYPRYWKPRRPVAWRVHYGFASVFRPHCRIAVGPRVVRARSIYTPRRTTAVVVKNRSVRHTRVVHKSAVRKPAVVKQKTTTTRVVGKKNGKVVAGKKTTTTTTVKNRRGKTVAGKKTTKTTTVKKNKRGATRVKKTKKVRKGRRH